MSIFIHESSYVDDGAVVGEGSKIWHFCHIMPKAVIGKNCIIGQNVFIADDVVIGDGIKIQNNVSVYKGVTIEDDVFVGPSVVFTNVLYPKAYVEQKDNFKPTLIKKGAVLGANSTIVCGNIIGQYAMVAAGAVVTKNVEPYSIVAGVPAGVMGYVDK